MEKVDFIKDSGCWWMVRRLTQWELRESMTNKICPRCDDKEEPKHDCKRKSWAILVVEEDDRDDEGVLIVFDSEKRRKEAEIENFGKKIVDLGDWKKKSKVYSETVDDANEIQLPEFTLSLGCSVPEMKMLNSGEGGAHEERRGGGRRVYNPTRPNKPFTQPKPNSLNQNPSLLNLAQYLTQFFINPSTNPIKIYDPGPNNPLPFTHPISNHLSTRPTPISYLKNHRLQTLTMSVDIPYDLIKQVQIAILKEANLSSFDPDDASVPDLPSSQSSLSEFDPSPLYLRCKHCKGRLLRGFVSLICVFCDKKEAQQETTPEPINFKSTFGCRWLPQSLALDGFEIAGAPVKANELNRGQTELEEFPILDFLDLEIQWQPELEKVESESDKSCLHLVGIPLDNFFTEGKKDIVSDQQTLEDQNDDSSVDHDFQVRDNHSSLENIKCFEPAVRSTEDKSGDDSFDGWEASFQSADDGNVHEESKLDNPVVETTVDLSAHMDAVFGSENIGSSATKPSDWFQDDLWSTSNSEEVGKSKQVDLTAATEDDGMVENVNNSSSMSIDFIQDALWKSESTSAPDNKTIHDEDDSFDVWNDFTGSTTVDNPTNSEAKQFEVTAVVKDGGEVEKANNLSSRSIDLVQGDQLQIDNIEIPDNKVNNEEDDSFDAWNDFASSNSVQNTFNRQTGEAKQFEVNPNLKGGEMENAKNSSSMNVDWFQDDQWQTTSKEAPDNKTVDVEDDLFDTWNDFTSSVSAQDPFNMQSGQTMQFEVTATVRDDKMVGNANNSTSIAWIQNDHWPISSNKIPDSKTIEQGNDLFDTWNDFTGSTSVQDFPNEQTTSAEQSEFTANVEVNNSSFDWFQADRGQSSSNKPPGDKTTEEDYDLFDAWSGFTGSTSAQDPSIKQSVDQLAPSIEQTSEMKFRGTNNNVQNDAFGSFSQAHFFPGAFSDQNGSKEVNNMHSEPSVSKSLPDINATKGGNAREAAITEDVSNTTTKSTTNDVEMLLSQMHDLSFMLASNLSVPSKRDEFGSFSKH